MEYRGCFMFKISRKCKMHFLMYFLHFSVHTGKGSITQDCLMLWNRTLYCTHKPPRPTLTDVAQDGPALREVELDAQLLVNLRRWVVHDGDWNGRLRLTSCKC